MCCTCVRRQIVHELMSHLAQVCDRQHPNALATQRALNGATYSYLTVCHGAPWVFFFAGWVGPGLGSTGSTEDVPAAVRLLVAVAISVYALAEVRAFWNALKSRCCRCGEP
jgi:hypothetical protein